MKILIIFRRRFAPVKPKFRSNEEKLSPDYFALTDYQLIFSLAVVVLRSLYPKVVAKLLRTISISNGINDRNN